MIFFSDRLGSSCFLSLRWGLTYVARLSLCLQYLSVEKTVIWFIISIVLLLKDWRKNRSKAIFMTEIKIFPLRIYWWWWSGKWWWNVPHWSKVWPALFVSLRWQLCRMLLRHLFFVSLNYYYRNRHHYHQCYLHCYHHYYYCHYFCCAKKVCIMKLWEPLTIFEVILTSQLGIDQSKSR